MMSATVSGSVRRVAADWIAAGIEPPPTGLPSHAEVRDERALLLVTRLAATAPQQHRAVVTSILTQQMLRTLGLDPSYPFDVYQPLSELGMDSLMAMELKAHMEQLVGRKLSSAILLDHPTLDALAGYLIEHLTLSTAQSA